MKVIVGGVFVDEGNGLHAVGTVVFAAHYLYLVVVAALLLIVPLSDQFNIDNGVFLGNNKNGTKSKPRAK